MTLSASQLILCAADPTDTGSPENGTWIKLLPAGTFSTRDGRGPFHAGEKAGMTAILQRTKDYLGGTEMMIDYDHQSVFGAVKGVGGTAKAAGWVKDFEVRDDGIYGRVEWTAAAKSAIEAGEYRYISPTFAPDKKTRQVSLLFSAALLNTPAMDLSAVAAHAEFSLTKGSDMDELLEALGLAEDATLADAVSAIEALIAAQSAIALAVTEFADWDGPYVRERVLAAAMAGALNNQDATVLKSVAKAADEMVFKKEPIERHAWTRRYAQIIVEYANKNGAEIDEGALERSRPPYQSEPITEWPSLEYVASKSKEARSIVHSVVGFFGKAFDGKAPMMAGDFGRYRMGGIDNNFSRDVRGESLPLTRKDEIVEFWCSVDDLNGDIQDAKTKLLEADAVEESKSSLENEFLKKLPDDLQKRYSELKPLDRYRSDGIPMFWLLQGQCWVANRCFELGWKADVHGEIERNVLRYTHDRTNHHVERIGKKYQHIAFEELIGYLADHHWYVDYYSNEPKILNKLEVFERPDIDPTFLAGVYSGSSEGYDPGDIQTPKLAFRPTDVDANVAWTKTTEDIPDPAPFLVQRGNDGHEWCLASYFTRSDGYVYGYEASEPFRSGQLGVELILVDNADLDRWARLTTDQLLADPHDVLENTWSISDFFGQRTHTYVDVDAKLRLSRTAGGLKFGHISQLFSPKYSEYDNSGVSEEADFATPHSALVAELKLSPKNPWSRLFVTDNGSPAFISRTDEETNLLLARRDVLSKFTEKNNLHLVWRVWVEKDGGKGTDHGNADLNTFSRKGYLGFFFECAGEWRGKYIPFRD